MRYQTARRFSISMFLLGAIASSAGCALAASGPDDDATTQVSSAVSLVEGFEAASKTSYAAANVALATGTWNLSDALIGTLSTDVFTGTRSARMRNSGKITMEFDRSAGAGTVTIHHATYGADSNGTWGLFESQDGGASWAQVGTSRSTTPGTFSTATFTVNLSGAIRFEIRKLDGGTNRINIDDVSITDFGTTGGGGGSGGGTTGAALSKHTTLGIPAPTSTTTPDAFLSLKAGYTLSYNGSRKVPNWVSWELNTSYLGSTARQDDFRPDDTFPASEPQASLADYQGGGYDRGHMCPSADRTLTVTANQETFYLTNMVPQAANNNEGPWADLENELRTIAHSGKELFIVSGGTFSASSNKIGTGVVVPDQTWKVAVVLDQVGQGPANVTTATRVIAVMMPNENNQISISAPWRNFRVSVDAIEAATGYDLLSDVPSAVQSVVEARVDNQ
ncbi:MAG TPA: DNA/RNA non-specific endonuclease [Kofleriaceae bacterium]|nr:DNA/RNA non-specific endonuclease [Kofleriaceae bacterium]